MVLRAQFSTLRIHVLALYPRNVMLKALKQVVAVQKKAAIQKRLLQQTKMFVKTLISIILRILLTMKSLFGIV